MLSQSGPLPERREVDRQWRVQVTSLDCREYKKELHDSDDLHKQLPNGNLVKNDLFGLSFELSPRWILQRKKTLVLHLREKSTLKAVSLPERMISKKTRSLAAVRSTSELSAGFERPHS